MELITLISVEDGQGYCNWVCLSVCLFVHVYNLKSLLWILLIFEEGVYSLLGNFFKDDSDPESREYFSLLFTNMLYLLQTKSDSTEDYIYKRQGRWVVGSLNANQLKRDNWENKMMVTVEPFIEFQRPQLGKIHFVIFVWHYPRVRLVAS